jgi:hypothetical protein
MVPSPRERGRKKKNLAWCWWLTPVILVTQEEEIRRIAVEGQRGGWRGIVL